MRTHSNALIRSVTQSSPRSRIRLSQSGCSQRCWHRISKLLLGIFVCVFSEKKVSLCALLTRLHSINCTSKCMNESHATINYHQYIFWTCILISFISIQWQFVSFRMILVCKTPSQISRTHAQRHVIMISARKIVIFEYARWSIWSFFSWCQDAPHWLMRRRLPQLLAVSAKFISYFHYSVAKSYRIDCPKC